MEYIFTERAHLMCPNMCFGIVECINAELNESRIADTVKCLSQAHPFLRALISQGVIIWFIGALRSDMDENIKENHLKTNGIYAWVRNPMYSGWWILISGISLLWHNVWLVPVIFINWCIMTIVLKNTEEKWLRDLYGKEYEDYCKRVNRCIPFKRG